MGRKKTMRKNIVRRKTMRKNSVRRKTMRKNSVRRKTMRKNSVRRNNYYKKKQCGGREASQEEEAFKRILEGEAAERDISLNKHVLNQELEVPCNGNICGYAVNDDKSLTEDPTLTEGPTLQRRNCFSSNTGEKGYPCLSHLSEEDCVGARDLLNTSCKWVDKAGSLAGRDPGKGGKRERIMAAAKKAIIESNRNLPGVDATTRKGKAAYKTARVVHGSAAAALAASPIPGGLLLAAPVSAATSAMARGASNVASNVVRRVADRKRISPGIP